MPRRSTQPGRQLALPLRLDPQANFETLVDGANSAAFTHVRQLASTARGDVLWLWGGPGRGKSHALQAACREADEAGKRAMYVPLDAAAEAGPELLADLDTLDFLALDALDPLAGSAEWETRLFAVLNGFQSRERTLLIAARQAPSAIAFALPDLASRAAGAIVYRIRALDDEEQALALIRHARHRGLTLDAAAARFLQARVARDMPALCAWLGRLDAASLQAQRRITIPFIREALQGGQAAP
ncbi:MAG: DnaA regulatory inactivator Hda [Gammaproteobacteria bacterium]|nr:DnaA regulatory inactivator Hda [Gammaproteobacteria bacterium]